MQNDFISRMEKFQLPLPVLSSEYISPKIFNQIINNVPDKIPLVLDSFISEETCENIINEYDDGNAKRRTYQGEENIAYRDCKSVNLPNKYFYLFETFIIEYLTPYFGFQFDLNFKFVPQIYKYEKGPGFKEHHDMVTEKEIANHQSNNTLVIGGDYTMTLFLNDMNADQGGQFQFCDFEEMKIQSRAGRIVAFRVDYIHKVLPINYGSRYSVVARALIK